MRIVHLISGTGIGGAETMLDSLVQALGPDFQSTVISLEALGPIGERIRARGAAIESLGLNPARPDPRALLRLVGRLRQLRPDVVHTWLYHADLLGGLAARMARTGRIAWAVHNSEMLDATVKPRTRAIIRTCALLSRVLPHRILSCSEVARGVHAAYGYPDDRFTVIPNGLDVARFQPDPGARPSVLAELGLPGDSELVGLIARWDPQKNHAGFLEAAAAVHRRRPSTRFVLAGRQVDDGNPVLREQVASHGLGDSVRLLGPRHDVPRLVAGLDLLVSASGYGEAFPIVIGEAMASGVPCVATDVGDCATLVADTGRIVAPGDMNALADAICAVLSLPGAERRALGARARDRIATEFAIDRVARRYEAFYRDLVAGRS